MKRKISVLLATIAMFAAGASLMTGCEQQQPAASGAMSDEQEAVRVETVTVSTSSFTRKRAYVGNISAAKMVKVIPLANERILKYPWENGDFVQKGQVIAEIRNEVSKKGLEAMNAQIKSVDAQLKAAERELKRVQSMYESNIVSRQNLDQAQDGVTTLLATKQQLLATLEQTKLGLDYSRVLAPIDGVISNKNSEVGDIASSAMPLCILNDLETLKVTLNVKEEDTPYLRLGQDVRIRFDAFPGEDEVVVAKITRIMPYVNTATRTNTVEAEFPNKKLEKTGQYKYKPGMYSRAELSLETTDDAIMIPPVALILDPELLAEQKMGQSLRRVYVLKSDNTVQARVVEVGEYSDNMAEILRNEAGGETRNLMPGDKLVVRGHHSLRDGEKVLDVTKKGEAAIAAAPAEPAQDKAEPAAQKDAVPETEPAKVEGS